jgi:hypothetical protein
VEDEQRYKERWKWGESSSGMRELSYSDGVTAMTSYGASLFWPKGFTGQRALKLPGAARCLHGKTRTCDRARSSRSFYPLFPKDERSLFPQFVATDEQKKHMSDAASAPLQPIC